MVAIILKGKKGKRVIKVSGMCVFFLVDSDVRRTGMVKESRKASLIEKEWPMQEKGKLRPRMT